VVTKGKLSLSKLGLRLLASIRSLLFLSERLPDRSNVDANQGSVRVDARVQNQNAKREKLFPMF
jgi:hypothetical protein